MAVQNITAATWATGNATFTTSAAHGLVPGNQVTINSVVPPGYNGTFVAAAGTTGSTIVVAMPTNPGTYTSGGTAGLGDPFSVYPKMRAGLIALASDGSIWYTAKNAMTQVAPAGTVTHPDALAAAGAVPTATEEEPRVHDDDEEHENEHKHKRHRR